MQACPARLALSFDVVLPNDLPNDNKNDLPG